MVTRSSLIVAFLSCLVLVSAGCKKDLPDSVKQVDLNSVMGMVANDPQFSTLWGLISAADVRDDLHGKHDKTLLAPTNQAFSELGQEELDSLIQPANKPQLQDIIRNLIIDGAVTAPELAAGKFGVNQLARQLTTGKDDSGATTVEGARVIRSMRADNGYIHVIDMAILPVAPGSTSAE